MTFRPIINSEDTAQLELFTIDRNNHCVVDPQINYVSIDSSNLILMKISLNFNGHCKLLNKVIIKLISYYINDCTLWISRCDALGNILEPNILKLEYVSELSADYFTADIADILLNEGTNEQYFAITAPDDELSIDIYNQNSETKKPEISIYFEDLLSKSYLVKKNERIKNYTLGKNTFGIDLHTGISRFYYSLVDYGSNSYNFNLSLVWARERNRYRSYNNIDIGLPYGLKLSCHMFLQREHLNLLLIDQNYEIHTFKRCGLSNIYIDSSGSGLFIELINGSDYLLTDEEFNQFVFNTDGLLTEIKIFNHGFYHSIYLNYEQNTARITHIYDNDLIDINITYSYDRIIFNFGSYKNNIVIYQSGYKLTRIEEIYFESYNYSFYIPNTSGLEEYLIQDITFNKRKLHFEYDYFRRIRSISESNIYNEDLSNLKINFGKHLTELELLPFNSDSLKTNWFLSFDKVGNCLQEYLFDNRGYKLVNSFDYNDNIESAFEMATSLGSILPVNDGLIEDYEDYYLATDLIANNQYTALILFDFDHSFDNDNEDELVSIEIFEHNNLLASRIYKSHELSKKNYKFIPFIPNLDNFSDYSANIFVRVRKYNSRNIIKVQTVQIQIGDKSSIVHKCSSLNLGDLVEEFPESETFYSFINSYLIRYVKNGNLITEELNINYEDIARTIIVNKVLNKSFLFYKSGNKLMPDVSMVEIQQQNGSYKSLNEIKLSKISKYQFSERDKYISRNDFYIENNNFVNKVIQRHLYDNEEAIDSSEVVLDFCLKTISSMDQEHVVSSYNYSNNGLLSQIIRSKDGKAISVNSSYDQHGDLVNQSYYLNGNIVSENYNYENHLVINSSINSISQTDYFYDNNRNLSRIEQDSFYNQIFNNNDNSNIQCAFDNHNNDNSIINVQYDYDNFDRLNSIYIFGHPFANFYTTFEDNHIDEVEEYPYGVVIRQYDKYNRLIHYENTNDSITYYYGSTRNNPFNNEFNKQLTDIKYTYNGSEETIHYTYDSCKRLQNITQGRQKVTYSYEASNVQTSYFTCVKKDYSDITNPNYIRLKEIEYSCRTIESYNKQITKKIHNYDYSLLIIHQLNAYFDSGFSEIVDINNYKLIKETQKCSGDTSDSHSISELIERENFFKLYNGNSQTIGTINYEYYSNGKIKKIINNFGQLAASEYFYDNYGRLSSEIITINGITDLFNYSYDNYGNLNQITNNSISTQLLFNDKNWLISKNGQNVYTYDDYGYPTCFNLNNVSFEDGMMRQFGNYNFYYDAFKRLREIKLDDNNKVIIDYFDDRIFDFNKIINNIEYKLNFVYGAQNKIIGFIFNNQFYYILYNILNDVVAILDNQQNVFARYVYDGFGNCKIYDSQNNLITNSTHLAKIFPFRYRSYFYVEETSLYYITSRYYDPEIGRFISPDSVDYLDPTTINGLNLYAYCGNDPVNYYDPSGHSPQWLQGLAIGLGIVGGILVVGAACVLTFGVGALAGTMAGAIIYGASQGIVIGATIGTIGGTLIGGATTDWSVEGMLIGAGIGLGSGAIVGGIIGGFAGASNFATNSAYITSYKGNVKETLTAFKGNPKLKSVGNNTTVYRYWGGSSGKFGHWVSPVNYGSSARSMLSLPASNTMTNMSTFSVNGLALQGKAAALFGQVGGGIQWWIGLL